MFACLVDGEPWIAETPPSISGPIPLSGEYNSSGGFLTLQATRKNTDNNLYDKFYIYGFDIYGIINDSIRSQNPEPVGFINYMTSNCQEYYHDTIQKGVLNITHFDNINYIISGTFSMDLFNPSCSTEIMHITNGRFDFKYSY